MTDKITSLDFPLWQLHLRKAQKTMQEQQALEAETARQEQLRDTRIRAAELQDALAHFGIEVTPSSDQATIGNFTFSITYNYQTPKRPNGGYEFWLTVTYTHDGYIDDDPFPLTKTVAVHCAADSDWTPYRAKLADYIDELDAKAPAVLMQIQEHDARRQAKLNPPETPASVEQQLGEVIRRLIRQELDTKYI